MAYATDEDVEAQLGRSLTVTEQAQVTGWLEDAAILIDAYTGTADPDPVPASYKRVSVNMVVRALGASDMVPGASSGTETVGPFSRTVQFIRDAAPGGVWLSSVDKTMLRGRGFTSAPLGSERRY